MVCLAKTFFLFSGSPQYAAFLSEIFRGDAELVEFVQRLAGYSLTGDVRERIFPVLWGAGRNGKSTLLELLQELLGDYAMSTPPETLVNRREGAIPNDLARLRGAVLATALSR